jgi:hypothetical protein
VPHTETLSHKNKKTKKNKKPIERERGMTVNPVLGRLKQEYSEYEANLGCLGKPCLKIK